MALHIFTSRLITRGHKLTTERLKMHNSKSRDTFSVSPDTHYTRRTDTCVDCSLI